MDYVVGSVAALISGNVTPSRPKLSRKALTPTKHRPSPNVTPKSEFVEDRSIFLSPTQQKKKAIIKKSPKRIFQNPDLDATEDSEGNSSVTSPKAEKVKKHLKEELESDSMISKDSKKSPKTHNNPEKSYDEVSPEKKSKNSITDDDTPKKKKKKRDSENESEKIDQNESYTQTESKDTLNVKKNNMQRRKSILVDDSEIQNEEVVKNPSPKKVKSISAIQNNEIETTQVVSDQSGKKKNKKRNKKNKKSHQDTESTVTENTDNINVENNKQDSPGLEKQTQNKKNRKNKSKQTKNTETENKSEDAEKMNVEETNSDSESEEVKSKNIPNPNAITNKDSDSEHDSDDEIDSENEGTNDKILTNEGAQNEESSDEQEKEQEKNKSKEKKVEKQKEPITEDEIKRTLFVGNVPFSNKCKKEIKKIFSKYGQIETIRIRTVPVKDARVTPKLAIIKNELHPERTTVNVYVKFADASSVNKALSENNTTLNGNHLRVTRSDSTGAEHDPSCAVFLGNLPFGIEDETLRSKFENCGEITSVRVIRDKKTNAGKGFGYVNFASKDGVELALALSEEDLTIKNRIIRVKRCTQAQSHGQKPGGKFNRGKFNNKGKFNNRGDFNNRGNLNSRGNFNNEGKFNSKGNFNNEGKFNNRGKFNSEGTQGGGRNFAAKRNQSGQEDGAARRLMQKRKLQESAGDGPPNKKQNINQPSKEKKPRKQFVGMTAEKKKKNKFDKGQKKKKALSEILTKKQ